MKDLIEVRANLQDGDIAADIAANTITGMAMRYGDVASVAGQFYEKVAAGAFGAPQDVVLNVQHDRSRPIARTNGGGLELTDTPAALRVAAKPIETRDGKDALLMVHHRVLRGFSVEFIARREDYVNDVRIIHEAELVGIGLVDRPAYGAAVAEVAKRMAMRGRKRRWL